MLNRELPTDGMVTKPLGSHNLHVYPRLIAAAGHVQ